MLIMLGSLKPMLWTLLLTMSVCAGYGMFRGFGLLIDWLLRRLISKGRK